MNQYNHSYAAIMVSKKLPNNSWARCYHFRDTIGYHSNSITC